MFRASRSQSLARRLAVSEAPREHSAAASGPVPKRNRILVPLALALLCAASALVGWLTWELRGVTVTEAGVMQIRLADQAAAALARTIDLNVLLMEAIRI